MSLLSYFPSKGKTGKKKNKSASKRKLSTDKAVEEKDDEFDEPQAKRQRLSKTKSNDSGKDKNQEKTTAKYVSDDNNEDEEEEEEEEEDFDVNQENSNSNNSNKNKNKSKSGDKDKDNDDEKETKEESLDAQWKAIQSKIDISKLNYSNCDELLHPSWKKQLKNEFNKPYYNALRKHLAQEEKSGAEIFPPVDKVFRAFELCPWDNLKVVILGQDPYHDNGQAEGLCFSVPQGIKIPSSLKNMYKEAGTDIGMKMPNHGSLVEWGKQGVLLLNTVLTVHAHKANSHKKYGWQQFTDAVISRISRSHDGVVFIFWGKQAQKKGDLIDKTKHRIIQSAHPSGLSASRGFYGSKPYSKTNQLLKQLGKSPIDWTIR